ncbi:hypothetical protein MMC26_007256 [Xylographa opegraphella]|nr:hypothetical protein [Xylographa opegraphella]
MAPTTTPLSSIPTLSLLYKLRHLHPAAPSPSLPTPSPALNNTIRLVRTDITTLAVSAIVNAANTSLLGGGGVDGAIHSRAGSGLYNECLTLHGCATGAAKMTGAYNLPCEKIIHAVGPVYWQAKEERPGLERELLASCYTKSLDLAEQAGCASVAFSSLSTGVYGYPSGEAAQVACEAVRGWLEAGERKVRSVVFCVFERKDEKAYEEWLPKIFPPVEEESKTAHEHDELVEAMPDPPADEPLGGGKSGSSAAKGVPEVDEGWEAIEKPGQEAENGYVEDATLERSEMTAEEQIALEEANEERLTALQTTEAGGDPHPPTVNPLMKDW